MDRATAETMAAASTERYRHDCEVRSLVAKYQKEGGEAVKVFLAQVAKHRGQPAADRLMADALKQLSVRQNG